jgi:hypothetical protein
MKSNEEIMSKWKRSGQAPWLWFRSAVERLFVAKLFAVQFAIFVFWARLVVCARAIAFAHFAPDVAGANVLLGTHVVFIHHAPAWSWFRSAVGRLFIAKPFAAQFAIFVFWARLVACARAITCAHFASGVAGASLPLGARAGFTHHAPARWQAAHLLGRRAYLEL